MMRLQAMICVAMLAGCAATQGEVKLDGQVTKLKGTNGDAAKQAALPSAPAPQVDAVSPGSDWLLKRDAQAYPNGPLAAVLLLNPARNAQATVAITLLPTAGTPKEMAEVQRGNLQGVGVTCSKVTVSKDGSQASFTIVLKLANGQVRKGKTVYLLSKDRKDYTAALYAAWNSQSDKAMLAATDKIAASVTVK